MKEKGSSYRPINDSSLTEEEWDKQSSICLVGRVKQQSFLVLILAFSLLGMVVTGLISYNIGRASAVDSLTSKVTFRTVTQTFEYNRTFSEPPTPANNAAWNSLFPPHGGFFHDKTIAENGASLAVYHQLHCLRGIREAYWVLYNGVITGKNVSFSTLPDYSTPWHTRHCIDFLRQMLMCNADVTIERNVPDLGGIKGFDVPHLCKRYDDIIQWTLDRQVDAEAQGHVNERV